MLYFVYTELAVGYILFSFLSSLGVLQIVAAHERMAGLALFDRARHRMWGYVLGAALIATSTWAFFASQWWRILTPGPAGAELSLLYAVSAGGALVLTLALVSIKRRAGSDTLAVPSMTHGQVVPLGAATGVLSIPGGLESPGPALCLLCGPWSDRSSIGRMADQIVQRGWIALLVALDRHAYTFPEILTVLPAATSLLTKRPEVDPNGVGAVGYDLDAGLAIRSACCDKKVKAVAALAPVLERTAPSLDLLRDMSFSQAWSWAYDHQRSRVLDELHPLDLLPRLEARSLLLVYGANDRLAWRTEVGNGPAPSATNVSPLAAAAISSIDVPGLGHTDLLSSPVLTERLLSWFEEHL